MAHLNQREALIDSAMILFHRQGYASTGAREIASHAELPHGSFTNHFRSKEVLAVAALDRYVSTLQQVTRATLDDRSKPPVERLLAYFDAIEERLATASWRHGCLIPDLAAGLPVDGDLMRARLVEVLQAQTECFQAVVDEIGPGHPEMGAFIVAAWHGTLLRMKAERGPESLQRFRRSLLCLLAAWQPVRLYGNV